MRTPRTLNALPPLKLRKHHVVRPRTGGGHGVIQWLGKQGGTPMALVRWDAGGALTLIQQEWLEVVCIGSVAVSLQRQAGGNDGR